jgi:hypothetical protein
VEPVLLKLQRSAAAIGCQPGELPAFGKTLRKTRVQLGRNFAAPSLRAQNASDRDERGSYSTISN